MTELTLDDAAQLSNDIAVVLADIMLDGFDAPNKADALEALSENLVGFAQDRLARIHEIMVRNAAIGQTLDEVADEARPAIVSALAQQSAANYHEFDVLSFDATGYWTKCMESR